MYEGSQTPSWGEVHMKMWMPLRASRRERSRLRTKSVPSPASRSGAGCPACPNFLCICYATPGDASGRHDMHRVFPFGSRKTWSLNVLPHLVQSNGVVGLRPAVGGCSAGPQERRRHAPGGAPGATLVRRTRLSHHLLENPWDRVGGWNEQAPWRELGGPRPGRGAASPRLRLRRSSRAMAASALVDGADIDRLIRRSAATST